MIAKNMKKSIGDICKEVAIKSVNASCWYCFYKVEVPKELKKYLKDRYDE